MQSVVRYVFGLVDWKARPKPGQCVLLQMGPLTKIHFLGIVHTLRPITTAYYSL
jgi:hypothetical protein